MKVTPFEMERLQPTWENIVEFNLSESGVHPLTLREILNGNAGFSEGLLDEALGYSQSNGTIELREKISALYPGSTPDHILVTNGTAEANYLAIWNLLEQDEELVVMHPNYMQIWGIGNAYSGRIRKFSLHAANEWRPDIDELRKTVTPKTKIIAVCNPNNPTGMILTADEMQQLVDVAAKNGAWILADEVYQGAERDRPETKSFWGRYDRLIVTNGLSKAYGLPGLRIGWMVSAPEKIASVWSYHDYTTIGPGLLSDKIARYVLASEVREKILSRTRKIIANNYEVFHSWLKTHGEHFEMVEPHAGAIAFFRYDFQIRSLELIEKLLHEKSVLLVPGIHFGYDHFIRLGYGSDPEHLQKAFSRIDDVLNSL